MNSASAKWSAISPDRRSSRTRDTSKPTVDRQRPIPSAITAFPLNAGGSITSVTLKYRTDTVSCIQQRHPERGSPTTRSPAPSPARRSASRCSTTTRSRTTTACTSVYPSNAEAATNPTRLSFWYLSAQFADAGSDIRGRSDQPPGRPFPERMPRSSRASRRTIRRTTRRAAARTRGSLKTHPGFRSIPTGLRRCRPSSRRKSSRWTSGSRPTPPTVMRCVSSSTLRGDGLEQRELRD